ncbi:MAG: glycine zipper 2TM domain-containing protein [Rhizomicrobium sp.]|jgi:osmotically inducible lipoprotein OsmB
MVSRNAKILAIAFLALGLSVAGANANCQGSKTAGTVLGAGGGGVIGSVITHGSPVGIIGGAVVGGLAGHSIAGENCRSHYYRRHGYYDRYHHWHYYG